MGEQLAVEAFRERSGASRVGASRGQVIVLFAIFMVGLMGLLGLATDLGFAFAQRRTMQNAADAGALAGARQIARYTSATPTSAQADVNTFVAANQMNTAPTVTDCVYVDYDNGPQGSCAATVPADATGVRVAVEETHDTFFVRLIPGAPDQVSVTATATAHVQRLNQGADAPFIICGPTAAEVTDDPDVKIKSATTSAITGIVDGEYRINSAAVGRIFRIHDPQISQNGGGAAGEAAGCKSKGARFNGLNNQDANDDKAVPGWYVYETGTKAGPTRSKVNGAQGCGANVAKPYNCVMLLPVATDTPEEDGSHDKQLYIVGFAAFHISQVDANSHNATLLDDYLASGPGSDDWCRDCGGAVVLHLSS